MASRKPAAQQTTEPANTSAPAAGELADVSATGAGQPVPLVETESASPATPTVTASEASPDGGEAATNDAAGQNAEPVVTHLLVRSLVPGFRRGGRAWPTEEVKVAVDDFSVEQLDQIMAEPMLNVMPVAE